LSLTLVLSKLPGFLSHSSGVPNDVFFGVAIML